MAELRNLDIVTDDVKDEFIDEIYQNGYLSIDVETTGLDWFENELATIQLHSGRVSTIFKKEDQKPLKLIQVFEDSQILKVFHHAMFDLRFISYNWDTQFKNVACTKVASKIINKNSTSHSLKYLLSSYLNVDIEKDQYDSNWKSKVLSIDQIRYALNDVIYLKDLFDTLMQSVYLDEVEDHIKSCFEFIPTLVWLQINRYEGTFEH